MISNFNKNPKDDAEKVKNNFFISFVGILLISSAIYFTSYGMIKLFIALFTAYEAKAIDLIYFTSGIMILFFIGITNILNEIKSQNKTIAKGVLHLLKHKLRTENKSENNTGTSFEDTIKNLFQSQLGLTEEEIKGSISVYDMSNPNNPIFEGDFKNADEMNEIRKNLIDKMLNSHKEFKGQKMTKQEMLDKMSLIELKDELKIAVDREDWLWAASIRDKISSKEESGEKGNSGS